MKESRVSDVQKMVFVVQWVRHGPKSEIQMYIPLHSSHRTRNNGVWTRNPEVSGAPVPGRFQVDAPGQRS